MSNNLLTADELASLLRTSRRAVYMMQLRKQIPGAIKVGRRLLFDRKAVEKWLGVRVEAQHGHQD
ncbi:MAG TPA: helix-turn-helix domain-containing protein, partial [Salinarimonas sp.]|nr:helix-turn-helix domain-containing protein [Salinarimonas sp.]